MHVRGVDLAARQLVKFSELDVQPKGFLSSISTSLSEQLMQLNFKSLARPRRAAKALRELIPGLRLTEAQDVVALMCGHSGWHELKVAADLRETIPCLDDEDLTAAELAARKDFQVAKVREHFNNTKAQARKIVDSCSPTARAPGAPVQKPEPAAPPLRGANVYTPSPFTRFDPDYPVVFGVLPDVRTLRIDFARGEPGYGDQPHLASSVEVHFRTGMTLKLNGAYFWKFLDVTPSALLDESGEPLSTNPYTAGSVDSMLKRLRGAYRYLFKADSDQPPEPPPEWVSLDLSNAILTRKNPIQLRGDALDALQTLVLAAAAKASVELQHVFDGFMVAALTGKRVELKYVPKGGRGSSYVGPAYVPSTWEGTGGWVVKDLLTEMSPEQFHESGCGGNLRYRELLIQQLKPHYAAILRQACKAAVADPALHKVLCEQLEKPEQLRAKVETRVQALYERLTGIDQAARLEVLVCNRLVRAQGSRTFNSWVPGLSTDPALVSPSDRINRMLDRFRTEKEGAKQ